MKKNALLLSILVDTLGLGLVYPVFVMMFGSGHNALLPPGSSLSLQHFYLGLAFLLYPLCLFFGASFNGDLSDYFGRKRILILCMLGVGISYLLMAFAVSIASLTLLLVGRGLSGLMAGSYPIAQAAVIDMSTAENKSLNLSIVVLANVFGMILGPLLGGFTSDNSLVSFFNYSTPFYISACLGFFAAFWLFISFKETFKPKKKITLSFLRPLHIFARAFQNKSVRWFSVAFLLMQIGWGNYLQLITLYLQTQFHYRNWQLGVFQGVLGCALALGLIVIIRYLVKYFNNRLILIMSLLITGISMILTSQLQKELSLWLLMIPIAAFDAVGFVAMLTAFSNAADKDAQGWVMGIASAEYAIAFVVPGLLTNLIPFTGVPPIILLSGFFFLIAGLIIWKIGE